MFQGMNSKIKSTVLLTTIGLLLVSPLISHAEESRDARMEWWREARFGMFVHWGLYSIPAGKWDDKTFKRGGVEWIQQRARVAPEVYEKRLIPQFAPKPGFAAGWAKAARTAGCKYLVFTSKHHEGFSLHDSALSSYDARDACGRDLFKEIVEATRAEGLKVGAYHSVIDWHHPQYDYIKAKGLPHPLAGKPYPNGPRDHKQYIDYLHGQVREIMSNYGPIDILWWDYSSTGFQGDEAWRAFELMDLVKKKQPHIIMNNRLFRIPEAGWKGMGQDGFHGILDPKYGDFITPEQHIPATGMPGIDWETCMTMNTSWGYNQFDDAWKPSSTLIRNLCDIASKGGNYLLNIGPKADGSIPEQSLRSMADIGRWMDSYGDSIYGSTASLFPKLPWGRSTTKLDKEGTGSIYLHVFDWPADRQLLLPGLLTPPQSAQLLNAGSKASLSCKLGPRGLTLSLPKDAPDAIASVIALRMDQRPVIVEARPQPDARGHLELLPKDATLHGGLKIEQKADHTDNIGLWTRASASADYKVRFPKAGSWKVAVEYAAPDAPAPSQALLTGADEKISFRLPSTGGWEKFKTLEAGTLRIATPGERSLHLQAQEFSGEGLMNLRRIILTPITQP